MSVDNITSCIPAFVLKKLFVGVELYFEKEFAYGIMYVVFTIYTYCSNNRLKKLLIKKFGKCIRLVNCKHLNIIIYHNRESSNMFAPKLVSQGVVR